MDGVLYLEPHKCQVRSDVSLLRWIWEHNFKVCAGLQVGKVVAAWLLAAESPARAWETTAGCVAACSEHGGSRHCAGRVDYIMGLEPLVTLGLPSEVAMPA